MGVKLGNYIRTIRKDLGLTVKDLAKHADISKSYLDYIESGNREPSPEKLKSIALALNIDVEKLIEIQAEDSINKAKSADISRTELIRKNRELEKFIEDSFKEYLNDNGWETHNPRNRFWGDISAKKDNEFWFIEVKLVNDYKKTSRMYSHSIIGSLVCNIENLGYEHKYSIVSNSCEFIKYLIGVIPRLITNSIDLTFFVVKDNGEVVLVDNISQNINPYPFW